MGNFLVTILTAFVTAIITWFGTNYYGRYMLKFWDLRLEVQKAIFLAVAANGSFSYDKEIGTQSRLRELAVEIDALRAVLAKPILWCLCKRGHDLHGAGQALFALSTKFDFCYLQKAQQHLKLPIDYSGPTIP